MDYKTVLQQVSEWKGVETQYWVAVNLLRSHNFISAKENDTCARRGLDCYTSDLINSRMIKLARYCQDKIDSESEKELTKSQEIIEHPDIRTDINNTELITDSEPKPHKKAR